MPKKRVGKEKRCLVCVLRGCTIEELKASLRKSEARAASWEATARSEGSIVMRQSIELLARTRMIDVLCRNLEIANERFGILVDVVYGLDQERYYLQNLLDKEYKPYLRKMGKKMDEIQALANGRDAELVSVRGKIAEAEAERDAFKRRALEEVRLAQEWKARAINCAIVHPSWYLRAWYWFYGTSVADHVRERW